MLYAFLQKNHPNLYKVTGKDKFDKAASSLQARAAELDWPHYVMGIYALLSLSGDGHTSMYPLPDSGPGFDSRYPVSTDTFADGVYVIGADKAYSSLVGKKLLSINGHSIQQIGARLSQYWPHNNPMWVERWLPTMLRRPGYLAGSDLTPGVSSAVLFEAAGADGKRVSVAVRPVEAKAEEAARGNWLQARNPGLKGPTSVHDDGKPFSFTVIDDGRTVYAAYRQSGDADSGEKVADFARSLYAAVANPKVRKLILDIRENGGGDNSFNYPVQLGAIQASNVNRAGGLYVITGRETFSAAQNLATFLERYSNATFVGEPTGSSPNHYGDLTQLEAPVSKLSIITSTVLWQDSSPHDTRMWIVPDLPAKPTFADYLAGRDAALDAARADLKGREPARDGDSWKRASQSLDWRPAWER